MDPWKDPMGVLDVFEKVREKADCRLMFCYNLASDDPQGMSIYNEVKKQAEKRFKKDDVLFVVGNNDSLVNAIQRVSSVILQKSTREGFCLTVTEALWKGKPVVASKAGGIPTQIEDEKNGFLVDPYDSSECAARIVELLNNPVLASELGENAKETVRERFLTTRLISDYLDLIMEMQS
jgi:trehalose synthase